MAYPPNFWDNYKTRNILSLIDRVRVLREYESYPKRPSFQSIATKFDCSPKQIKNIVMNRDSILRSYHESCSNRNEGLDDTVQKRQEKIEFLGKVMYEYVQRVLFYKYPIDDEKVRQKALQVKECIAVENFHPTSIWLEDFKLTYGIPAFDMETLRNNVPLTEEKHPHLSAIDMIQYVSQQEQEKS
ncbi:major centromere autoantigen B-like [Stomoxys calcitrans]|uniref:major centromere autoantigen B-like n=1 Tax=Stomoxys calcitrans TaxID=35570 RepID=UPI0027E307EC|nr:major centromere autoantigen B-like [Stomoxys calcitrans]